MTNGNNPINGNYKNYYTKRKFVKDGLDTRLNSIGLNDFNIFNNKKILDIGCNEGQVTIEIAQKFNPFRIIGVDLDKLLINKANKQLKLTWSLTKPLIEFDDGSDKGKRKRDDNDDNYTVPNNDYFPCSMPSMFGFLPFPKWLKGFPNNLKFLHFNIMTDDQSSLIEKNDSEKFDYILALSLTKWIHLNNGDEGLLDFFNRVHSLLQDDGKFIVETQSTKSYYNAINSMPELKESFNNLKIKPEDFQSILVNQIGFKSVKQCQNFENNQS